MRRPLTVLALACAIPTACSRDVELVDEASTTLGTETADGETGDEETDATDESDDEGPRLDVGPDDDTGGPEQCDVPDTGGSAPGACEQQAPPDSFEAKLEWSWDGPGDDVYSVSTPLVANLTDDDQNGEIDLCDVPDLVVSVFRPEVFQSLDNLYNATARLYALDGATGSEHWVAGDVSMWGIPALGDLDGDGQVEIVVPETLLGPLLAFEHDGSPMQGWTETYSEPGPVEQTSFVFASAIAIADLDQDGAPEVVVGSLVYDNHGELLVTLPSGGGAYATTTLVDLDEDGSMEIVVGNAAYTYAGGGDYVTYYEHPSVGYGHPHVADLDSDGSPEVLVSGGDGLSVLDFEGQPILVDQKPIDDDGVEAWGRPAAVHDFDGNGRPDWSLSVGAQYLLLGLDTSGMSPTIELQATWPVLDVSGIATGTAFDFLGDGSAEAMYGDEDFLWVFDSADPEAPALVQQARSSRTLIEYPVVADVDNDGSGEIVVVSNENVAGIDTSPAVQVFGDAEDRWIQARRIWNEHTYHVTNVHEDGTIPQVEAPHWKSFNTFRTNVQIEGGSACIPEG